jgi:hypothetical protein
MPDRDDSSNALVGALNYKACRDESRRVECLMHCVDSLEITASEHSNCIKSESEPTLQAE